MSTWYVVGEVHADGVLGVVGVWVRRNAAVRPLQDLALVGRVIVGYTHTECGVAVLLPELAELLHAERFPREERSGLLDHFHYLRGLSVRWRIGDQVRERLHRGEREREREREGGKEGEREREKEWEGRREREREREKEREGRRERESPHQTCPDRFNTWRVQEPTWTLGSRITSMIAVTMSG